MEACETSRASFAGLNILSRIMKQKAIFEENHIKMSSPQGIAFTVFGDYVASRYVSSCWTILRASSFQVWFDLSLSFVHANSLPKMVYFKHFIEFISKADSYKCVK